MEIIKLPGMNRELAPPGGWDAEKHGERAPLPVFAEVVQGSITMTSAWKPSTEELVALSNGGAVAMVVHGTVHPPVALGVFDPEHVPDARVPVLPADMLKELPEQVRRYIMWLETNGDPAHTLQDNYRLTEQNKALTVRLELDASALNGYVARLVAAVQGAVNGLVPPAHITEHRAEYWKAGARATIRAINEAIQNTPTADE